MSKTCKDNILLGIDTFFFFLFFFYKLLKLSFSLFIYFPCSKRKNSRKFVRKKIFNAWIETKWRVFLFFIFMFRKIILDFQPTKDFFVRIFLFCSDQNNYKNENWNDIYKNNVHKCKYICWKYVMMMIRLEQQPIINVS